MINKYEITVTDKPVQFLVYSKSELPKGDGKLKLLEENINIIDNKEVHELPIYSIEGFSMMLHPFLSRKQFLDKILEQAGIITFQDLCMAYFLVRAKKLNKSKRIRDYVEQKYSEIINLDYVPTDNTDKDVGDNNNKESKESII